MLVFVLAEISSVNLLICFKEFLVLGPLKRGLSLLGGGFPFLVPQECLADLKEQEDFANRGQELCVAPLG